MKKTQIKTNVKAGRITQNHNTTKVKTSVKGGRLSSNHNSTRR